MPWLPMYADSHDVAEVLTYLNRNVDCAWIVANGPKKWKAIEAVDALADGRHCLWVHSAGPLPLLNRGAPSNKFISDPWAGWQELRTGADPSTPYFGPGHPAVVWFNVHKRGHSAAGAIGMSSFEWIGNHYRIIGNPAPEQAEKWWRQLARHVKKSAKRIPRYGAVDGAEAEIWALPSAFQRMIEGAPRDDNPF